MAEASPTPAWLASAAGADVDPSEPLAVSARRIGHQAWFERRMFEVMGAWVPVEVDSDSKLFFGAHASHHGWRAGVWYERLPELAEMDREQLTKPGSDGVVAFFDALAASRSTIERLVGAYRVALPTSRAAATDHRHRTSAMADAPLRRWLGLLLHDIADDLDAGTRLLATKLISDDDLAEAADHQARFESLLPADG